MRGLSATPRSFSIGRMPARRGLIVPLAVTLKGRAPGSSKTPEPCEFRRGGMAEWSMAVVLKTTVPGRVPGVRIPLPPPEYRYFANKNYVLYFYPTFGSTF